MKTFPSNAAAALRRLMVRGALVLLPVALTLMVVKFALGLSDSLVGWLADMMTEFMPNSRIQDIMDSTPGLSFVALLALFMVVGAIASTTPGKALVRVLDGVFQRIPLARVVYSACRRTVDLFGRPNTAMFKRVVFLDMYPGGARVMGFVVNEVLDSASQEKYLVVAIPGKPNPTGVAVVVVPEKNTSDAGISSEEALRWGMSLGMLTPSELPITGPAHAKSPS